MIKRMGLFQRRQDLTQAQFSSYWSKKHSPLVIRMPKFLHYIQNHRLDLLANFTAGHLAFEIDGIAEMYWHNEQDMQHDFNSQQSIELLRQDETEFMSRISVCLVKEKVLQGKTAPIKLILCLSNLPKELKDIDFFHALPQMKGLQISYVEQVFTRPQLPELDTVPNVFLSLWFEQYTDVYDNFHAQAWMKFYQRCFSTVERMSVLSIFPLPIRIYSE